MGGNEGGNSGISEFLSLVLEPMAREQKGNMEINATNGLLADISDLNDVLDGDKKSNEVSTPEELFSNPQEELSSREGERSSHEEVPLGSQQHDQHTAWGEQTGHYPGSPCS